MRILVQAEPIDIGAETVAFTGAGEAGAVVTFIGVCRSEDGRLKALELEHYPGMAEGEIGRIAAEAATRWPLLRLAVIHRYGRIVPGEPIVFVATASEHRQPAFAAAEFLMDFMKTHAPFWKREHLVDGSVGEWVAAASRDEAATARWGAEAPAPPLPRR